MVKVLSNKVKDYYHKSPLASIIRASYLIFVIPIMGLLIFALVNMYRSNRQYESMINSLSVASDFSLDFKKDFDYETYLLIVGNRPVEKSNLTDMIDQANLVVEELLRYDQDSENRSRLDSVSKYLINLSTYKDRIENNLKEGNKYDENIEIWENDIQIVTSLVRETILQYIYYDTKEIQMAKTEYQYEYNRIMIFTIVAFFVISVLVMYASYKIPLGITKPIIELSEVTDQVAKGNLNVRSDAYQGAEVHMLSNSLNSMIDKINELLSQVTTEQIRLRKAEFELLQAQINPHFLYNTLDAIVWLAEAGEQQQVVKMVGSLSDFFRTSLNQGKDVVTIKEELMHVRSYLEIQHVRYQDILAFDIDVDKSFENSTIPKITLQPIVENALYHGIKNKRGLGHITITAADVEGFDDAKRSSCGGGEPDEVYEENVNDESGDVISDKKVRPANDESGDAVRGNSSGGGDFMITIRDDGIGMTEERLEKVLYEMTHMESKEKVVYGLYNVNERIKLNFGDKYGIRISSTFNEGTQVDVLLPKTAG